MFLKSCDSKITSLMRSNDLNITSDSFDPEITSKMSDKWFYDPFHRHSEVTIVSDPSNYFLVCV